MAQFNEARKLTKKAQEMYVAINSLRTELKNETLNHFEKAFDDEGFTEKSFWHWTPLKRPRRGRYAGEKILTNTGKLKRGTKAFANSNRNGFSIRFTNNVKYAAVHNEGLRAGRGAGFKMPKRMFMGYSTVLNRKLTRIFDDKIKRIFNK